MSAPLPIALQVLVEPGDLEPHCVIQGLPLVDVVVLRPFEDVVLRRYAVPLEYLMHPLAIVLDLEVVLQLGVDEEGRYLDLVGVLARAVAADPFAVCRELVETVR